MARLDHLNARIGARRSRLLGPEGFRELLLRLEIAGQVELLVRMGLLSAPPEVRAGGALAGVERSLRDALRGDEARLLREAEGRRPRRLLAAALALGGAQAIKVLLRGIVHAIPPERIAAAVPATEALPEGRVRELAVAPTAEAFADLLAAAGSPYAAPLREALGERARAGLLPAELAIDRTAFSQTQGAALGSGEDADALRAWLADRVDIRNALTLLALGPASPVRDLFLRGGRLLSAERFARLARSEPEARRRAIAAFAACVPERLTDPTLAERQLERWGTRRLQLAARRGPLSLAVPLAWLEARREEVRRIALVMRGTSLGLSGDAILDLVEG